MKTAFELQITSLQFNNYHKLVELLRSFPVKRFDVNGYYLTKLGDADSINFPDVEQFDRECGTTCCALGSAMINGVGVEVIQHQTDPIGSYERLNFHACIFAEWHSFFSYKWMRYNDTLDRCADRIEKWLNTGELTRLGDLA